MTKAQNRLQARHVRISERIRRLDAEYDKATTQAQRLEIDGRLYVQWAALGRAERRICAVPGDPIYKLKIALRSVAILEELDDQNWQMVQSALRDLENLSVPTTPPLQHPARRQDTQPECRVAA